MKGQGQLVPAAHADNISVHPGEYFHVLFRLFNIGGPDESHGDILHIPKVLHRVKTAKLSAVGISPHRDGQGLKPGAVVVAAFFRQQDQAGAGGENRQTAADHFPQRFKHI